MDTQEWRMAAAAAVAGGGGGGSACRHAWCWGRLGAVCVCSLALLRHAAAAERPDVVVVLLLGSPVGAAAADCVSCF